MLTKYRNDYAKIAMGFLSFEPDLKDYDHLQTELKLYTEEAGHELYLYKAAPDEDFTGVLGIETGPDFVMVRHLSLSPNVRNEATQFAVLADLRALYPQAKLMGSLENSPLITKFIQQDKEDNDGTHPRA